MNKIIRSALLVCGLAGYALTTAAAPTIPVRVITVEQAPHISERQISGRVEAIHSVDIRARTEGTIVQRYFQDGQYVNKGDLLFTLDDAQPKAALALAQAELKSAQASLRQARQLLNRYQQLKKDHSISRHDVDTAQMQRDVAAAAVEQAQARIAAQKITLDYTRITSPVTGRIGHSLFHVGSLVAPSSGVLVDVVQLDPIRVSFSLDETVFFDKAGQYRSIASLKQAWLAQVDIDGRRENGVLTSVDNRIDSRTASVALRAEFANPQHRLLPGGNVEIFFRPQQLQKGPMIPVSAMQQDAEGFYSWVLTTDNTVTMRRVTPGGQQGQYLAVTEGLKAGERVVTEGTQRLRDGIAVQLLK